MSHGARPTRRLRAVQPEDLRETASTVLPGSPRVAALDALLREVDGLRLTLETDLGAAADAVEAGDLKLAHDIIDTDVTGLRGFENRALGNLSALSAAPMVAPGERHWWSRVPAAPFVAAAALVGFLVGVLPTDLAPPATDSVTRLAANSSLGQLTQLASSGAPASQLQAASDRLHADLASLIAGSKNDPEIARQVLAWLSAERHVLQSTGDSSAITLLLRQSDALSRSVTAALPPAVRAVVTAPVVVPVVVPTPTPTKTTARAQPTAESVAQPQPRRTSSPSASPSASPSGSPSPSPSPAPSAKSTGGSTLPADPGLGG